VTSPGRVSGLEHLYMSDCAISRIEAGAFADLVHLRWLDLSDNRLTSLSDATFAGLRLHQLFLNGNRRLKFNGGRPFANLTVFGLYLHDCRLTRVDFETLAQLDGYLRVLWLSENQLSTLNSEWSRLFASLDHFRLDDNPLHCNCELSWLWHIYGDQRRKRGKDLMLEEAPECVSPAWLRGRHFNDLSEDDLQCRAPTLADVEVTLVNDDDDDDDADQSSSRRRLVLRCSATGDPTPNVYWIRPPTSASELLPAASTTQKDVVKDVGEALLVLNDDFVQSTSPGSGAFTCVASNVVGNVTVTVLRVPHTWQVASGTDHEIAPPHINGGVAEMTASDKRQLLIYRNIIPAELTTRSLGGSGYACRFSSINGTNSSSSRELCGGRDRRLRASSPLDLHGVQWFAASDDVRQYGLKHLVAAVVVTVLLTVTAVVAAVAVWLRHGDRSSSAVQSQHQRPVTDDAAGRTVSAATTSVCDTVVRLNRKALS